MSGHKTGGTPAYIETAEKSAVNQRSIPDQILFVLDNVGLHDSTIGKLTDKPNTYPTIELAIDRAIELMEQHPRLNPSIIKMKNGQAVANTLFSDPFTAEEWKRGKERIEYNKTKGALL